jgi:outer membrane protein OmpA-like peptidoglycan-associated protein
MTASFWIKGRYPTRRERPVQMRIRILFALCFVVQACVPESSPRTYSVIRDPRYLVFFDLDSTEIKPQAMPIIREAVKDFHEDQERVGQPLRLEIIGHTDRSGSAAHNRKLAEKRACAVADVLIRLGIPSDRLDVGGAPNTYRIATAEGVREIQNRFVEMVIGDPMVGITTPFSGGWVCQL